MNKLVVKMQSTD